MDILKNKISELEFYTVNPLQFWLLFSEFIVLTIVYSENNNQDGQEINRQLTVYVRSYNGNIIC